LSVFVGNGWHMSFVTWLALPVVITLVASLIMVLLSHRPRTNTHQDIENFARFRGALARQMAAPPPPGTVPLSSSPRPEPTVESAASARDGQAADTLSNATVVEDRQRPVRTGVAVSPDR
jgi:hypothetical protein